MNIEKTTREYFKNFEEMNLSELSNMFDDAIILKDWDIEVTGKKLVLEANKNIFNSVDNIGVVINNLYIVKQTAVAEILIHIDDNPPLPVVDIINFNDNSIVSITAYRGN